ncbi:MAG: acyltransferase [Candidatus Zixiibacteriota bacterium]
MMESLSLNLKKLFGYARGYLLKTKITTLGPIKSYGRTIIRNRRGKVIIGKRSLLWPKVVFDFTSAPPSTIPVVEIGEHTVLGDRTEVHCGHRVKIGNWVGISWDCLIMDNDYHAAGGGDAVPKPVLIEDEAWIGAKSIILKGVTIGKGAIVCAGSVVIADVPPYSFVAGNPARVMRKVESRVGTSPEA